MNVDEDTVQNLDLLLSELRLEYVIEHRNRYPRLQKGSRVLEGNMLLKAAYSVTMNTFRKILFSF